jgi:hypothetical protein
LCAMVLVALGDRLRCFNLRAFAVSGHQGITCCVRVPGTTDCWRWRRAIFFVVGAAAMWWTAELAQLNDPVSITRWRRFQAASATHSMVY